MDKENEATVRFVESSFYIIPSFITNRPTWQYTWSTDSCLEFLIILPESITWWQRINIHCPLTYQNSIQVNQYAFWIMQPRHGLQVKSSSKKEKFYLTTHSTHFMYGYMASDIWLRTILKVRKETGCRHVGYSFRLTARVLLYAPSHRQDSTYHGLCYTSRGALAGTRYSFSPRSYLVITAGGSTLRRNRSQLRVLSLLKYSDVVKSYPRRSTENISVKIL